MATLRLRKRPGLLLDCCDSSNGVDEELSYRLDDDTYRQEGFTIGKDFLRMDGVTMTRGELLPANLDIQENTVVGRGAFSTVRTAVWRRRDAADTIIALKESCCGMVAASKERRKMLVKELKALCELNSPFLVTLHGAFLQPEAQSVVIAIEFMNRGSLKDLMSQYGKFCEQTAAAMTLQMLCGLLFLHDHRVLHRDLKPANVLVHSCGRVKLCDFGLSTLLGEQSMNRSVVGTSKFMAPERLRAQPYGRMSDMWSLGLIVLEAVTGKPAWGDVESLVELVVTIEETTTADLVTANEEDDDEHISFRLREILASCLQTDPGKRIPAHLLLKSPWFPTVGVSSTEAAIDVVKAFFAD